MPLLFVRRDITTMHVDAVVNAANQTLLGGGGVDGAIHYAAGPELLEECRKLGGCRTGEAKITGGYRMPCRYIIHTVGPIYEDGMHGEAELLRACYRNSLKLAEENGCESVAFPAISTGAYGYPAADATAIAVNTVRDWLDTHDMTVYLVFFDGPGTRRRPGELDEYIRRHQFGSLSVDAAAFSYKKPAESFANAQMMVADACEEYAEAECEAPAESPVPLAGAAPAANAKAEAPKARKKNFFGVRKESAAREYAAPDFRSMLDESFSEMLLRKIDESGMTDTECYKRANIDRKLFSKIRSDRAYRPSKPTAIAFAVALRLGTGETEEMLRKAGYALSNSALFDVIIRYFIERGEYDVTKINEALFDYDQALLGA